MIQILLRCWSRAKTRIQITAGFLLVMTGMVGAWGNFEFGANPISTKAGLHEEAPAPADIGTSRKEPWNACLRHVARASGVHPALFEAIVKVESGRHPYAFGWYDGNRRWKSYKASNYADAVTHLRTLERQHVRFDMGLAQVNSRNLKILSQRTGLSSLHALEPCANLHLASVILREQIKIHGRTWRAVAGYNGAVEYAPKVYRVYCLQVHALHCRRHVPVAHLLSYPLPVLQTDTIPSDVPSKDFVSNPPSADAGVDWRFGNRRNVERMRRLSLPLTRPCFDSPEAAPAESCDSRL